MILETAQIEIAAGKEQEFEAGVRAALPLFRRAKGFRSLDLQRSVEMPSTYQMMVTWDTLENHTVDFRKSADFQEWRRLVGACFSGTPQVLHTAAVGVRIEP